MAFRGKSRTGRRGEPARSDLSGRLLKNAPSESDVSSLSDLSPSALEGLNITKESKFMKVTYYYHAHSIDAHKTDHSLVCTCTASVQRISDGSKHVS